MDRAREGTVRNLQELYTVVVGVALVVAIEAILREPRAGGSLIRWEYLPAFGAVLVTLIPFYHGAMRHFDQVYVEERGENVRSGALLADFLLLFIEACLLLAAARLIPDVNAAAWAIAILLVVDACWGAAVYLIFLTGARRWIELRWVIMNIVAGPALAILLLAASTPARGETDWFISIAFLLVAIVRTVVDYSVSWAFYFPWTLPGRRRPTEAPLKM